jgi:hypothetical protein
LSNQEGQVGQRKDGTVHKRTWGHDRLPIDARSIGRDQVLDPHLSIAQEEGAVAAGDHGVVDAMITPRSATKHEREVVDGDDTILLSALLTSLPTRHEMNFRHRLSPRPK